MATVGSDSDSSYSSLDAAGASTDDDDLDFMVSEHSDESEDDFGDDDAADDDDGGGDGGGDVFGADGKFDPAGWYEDPYDEDAPDGPYTVETPAFLCRPIGPATRNDHLSPLYLFRLFLSDPLVAKIIRYTNERGDARRGGTWKPLTAPEFWKWVCLHISMGINRFPSVRKTQCHITK